MEVNITETPTTALKPSSPAPEHATNLTPEQLENAGKKMLQVMGYETMDADTKKLEQDKLLPKPDQSPAPAEVKAPVEPAPKPTVEKAPEVKPRRVRMDPEALVKKTAEETAERMLATRPPAAPVVQPPVSTFEMTAEDKHDNEVLQHMETMDPATKGIADKHRAFVKSLSEYRSKWEAGHAGEQFDADAAEHTPFFDANQPQFEDKKFEDAEEDLKFERRYKARARETTYQQEKEIQEIKLERRLEKLNPTINAATADGIAEMVKYIDPEAFKIVSTPEGMLDLNQGTMAKLAQFDPVLARYLATAIKSVDKGIEEIRKFTDPELKKLGYTFKPNENPVHHDIWLEATNAERLLLEAPPEKRTRDGKDFVSTRQWNKLRDDAKGNAAKMQEISSKYWTFNGEDLERIYVAAKGADVKGKIEELEEFSSSRTKRGSALPKETPSTERTPTVEEPARTPERIAPPNLSSSADVVTTQQPGATNQKSAGDAALEAAFS